MEWAHYIINRIHQFIMLTIYRTKATEAGK